MLIRGIAIFWDYVWHFKYYFNYDNMYDILSTISIINVTEI